LQQATKPGSVKFQRLHRAQHPATQVDIKKTVINLSSVPLEDTEYLALRLNYEVALVVLLIEDIITSVEKAIVSLPQEAVQKVWQGTVWILKTSDRPRDSLSRAKRKALYGPFTQTLTSQSSMQTRATQLCSSTPRTTTRKSWPFRVPQLIEIAQGPN
jgi:hypothetical protein